MIRATELWGKPHFARTLQLIFPPRKAMRICKWACALARASKRRQMSLLPTRRGFLLNARARTHRNASGQIFTAGTASFFPHTASILSAVQQVVRSDRARVLNGARPIVRGQRRRRCGCLRFPVRQTISSRARAREREEEMAFVVSPQVRAEEGGERGRWYRGNRDWVARGNVSGLVQSKKSAIVGFLCRRRAVWILQRTCRSARRWTRFVFLSWFRGGRLYELNKFLHRCRRDGNWLFVPSGLKIEYDL